MERLEKRNGDTLMSLVRYCVKVKTTSIETTKKFLQWMKDEHGQDLLNIEGCLDYKVYQYDQLNLSCEYTFKSQALLDHYFKTEASKLRDKGLIRFSANEISFQRECSDLLLSSK